MVSILPRAGGIEHRVVGEPHPEDQAVPISPEIEDGYLWLMAPV